MEHNIENVLIHQKDQLLQLVNNGKFAKALLLLEFVNFLWHETGYTYKYLEIKQRIRQELNGRINDASHWKTERKYTELLAKV